MKTPHTLTMSSVKRLIFTLVVGAVSLGASLSAQTDLGEAKGTELKNVSLFLKIHNSTGLESFINETVTSGSPHFRQFLTVEQFTALYSPSQKDVEKIIGQLSAAGIHVTSVSANRLLLKATGTVATLNHYFNVSIHNYDNDGRRYHAPVTLPQIPSVTSDSLLAVTGLSSEAIYHSKMKFSSAADLGSRVPFVRRSLGTATGIPGSFTVGDVARLYQVEPLYKFGVSGQGRTLGIATLASFDPNDAYGYWSAIGLNVKANRITEVPVDGGADAIGADETTLDVEQSGGLAPKADIIVYESPNTDQGFLDLFVTAVEANKVDSLSVSWGAPEIAIDPELALAEDQIFLEAAAQGITLFAASGDSGAYDINDPSTLPFIFPFYTKTLTVDSPASSPYITAAGGITLAGTQQHKFGTVTVLKDRAWGWDYLEAYFNQNYADQGGYDVLGFPVGGGGGVSVNEDVPDYQKHLAGVKKSAHHQSLLFFPNFPSTSEAEDIVDLPGGFAGRNVPDISLNADPYTGYLLYFGGAMYSGSGGTSFVAPQLNGITALLGEVARGRIGFLNPTLYRMERHANRESIFAPFNEVTSGDNLFYKSERGYNPATGLGSINVSNIALRILIGEIDDD